MQSELADVQLLNVSERLKEGQQSWLPHRHCPLPRREQLKV
uniref:Uncharacterized protein n=1 Tax=Anguilla anguilla TaxID=7936 RepID=A0A0E9UDS8_ANGAN